MTTVAMLRLILECSIRSSHVYGGTSNFMLPMTFM